MTRMPAPIRRGEVLDDRYTIGDLLGAGGMGLVYAATQAPFARPVAIKLPRPELAAKSAVQREFRREAILASLIKHPNVVRVIDFVAGDPSYLVMEHVAGEQLGKLLEHRGPLPLDEAAGLLAQLLRALTAIHRLGVVHCDVKTDNVLVETRIDGGLRARLFDFGLARFERGIMSSREGHLCGTPEYLAPEVIRGEPARVAADIYGAGTILYELIVGQTPFAGGSGGDVLARHLDEPIVPMSWRCPDLAIPPQLDAVLETALAKDPAARYRDGRAFADALAAAVVETPKRATRPSRKVFRTDAPTCPIETPETAEVTAPEPDVDGVVVGFLERARALVDRHRLASAIAELENGVRVVGDTKPGWRIALTLAVLYEGVGDDEHARASGVRARELASCHASQLGRARATRYLAQLARRMSSSRYRRAP